MLTFLNTVAILPPNDGWKNLLFISLLALFVVLGCVAVIIRNERSLRPYEPKKRKDKKKSSK